MLWPVKRQKKIKKQCAETTQLSGGSQMRKKKQFTTMQ
jgi:hypothetical protein